MNNEEHTDDANTVVPARTGIPITSTVFVQPELSTGIREGEQISDEELMAGINIDNRFDYFPQEEGENHIRVVDSHTNFFEMEAFMRLIQGKGMAHFGVGSTPGNRTWIPKPLVKYFPLMNSFLQLRPDKRYSENLELGREVCHDLHLHQAKFNRPHDRSIFHDTWAHDLFCKFMAEVCKRAGAPEFQKKVAQREARCAANLASQQAYLESLFNRHAKIMVLRIDLLYKTFAVGKQGLKEAMEDITRLFNNCRHKKKIFSAMVGRIIKQEHSEFSGHHFHLILFFDGNRVHKDAHYGDLVGDYWVNVITEGRGRFENCNRHRNRYKHWGIGMVDHWDVQKRAVLHNTVLPYLCKKDQYLLERAYLDEDGKIKGVHTISRGKIPKVLYAARRGRPRKTRAHSRSSV